MRAILLALLLAAPSAQADDALIDAAKRAIGARMFDPYSAQFENITLGATAKGGPVVCGTVNAKNRMGGYVGRRPFWYIDDQTFDVTDRGRDPLFEAFCIKR